MPLVPSSVFSVWYTRQSWVYRSYAYLFQNPLWSRDLPKGASLCPLFWLAIFSTLIFRPLVYVTLALGLLVKLFHLRPFIEWTDELVRRLTGSRDRTFLMPTVMGLALLSMATFVGGILFDLVQVALAAGQLLPATLGAVNLIVAIACSCYCDRHKNDSSRCQVEWYLRGSLAASLILLSIFHSTSTFEFFVRWPWDIITGAGHYLAAFVVWCWHALLYLLVGMVHGTLWALFLGVCFIGLLLGGYLVDRFVIGDRDLITTPRPVKLTKEQVSDNLDVVANIPYHNRRITGESKWSYTRDLVRMLPGVANLIRSKINLTEAETIAAIPNLLDLFDAEVKRRTDVEASKSARCKAMTAAIARFFAPIVMIGKHTRALWAYGWAMIKARKQGACPYLRFED